MTLVQLRHFIALAESGSFRRSAQALFITQPALSRSIQSLEEELEQPLFDRIGWRSELTPFGREVLAHARKLTAEAQDLKDMAQRLSRGLVGSLRLGLGSGPGAILTVPVLQYMATHHPAAYVEVSRGPTHQLELDLRARRLDALVVDARSIMPTPDFHVEPLSEMRGAFLCRPGHPLTRKRKTGEKGLKFEDLRMYPMASTPLSDEIARLLLERYGPQAHLQDLITLRCEDIGPLVAVVRQSNAVLLAVRHSAPDLVELNLQPALAATARFAMVTLAGRSEPPLLPVVRQLATDLLKDQT
jgi:DNA-binding transcriptional LysR family regulator